MHRRIKTAIEEGVETTTEVVEVEMIDMVGATKEIDMITREEIMEAEITTIPEVVMMVEIGDNSIITADLMIDQGTTLK
jgi:hypothetical protein